MDNSRERSEIRLWLVTQQSPFPYLGGSYFAGYAHVKSPTEILVEKSSGTGLAPHMYTELCITFTTETYGNLIFFKYIFIYFF